MIFDWVDISHIVLSDNLEEWKKIKHFFPPSFFTVKIMNVKRIRNAYFDAPNHCFRYVSDVWKDKPIKTVIAWCRKSLELSKKNKI